MQQGTQGTPNRSQIIGIIIVIVIAAVVLLPRLLATIQPRHKPFRRFHSSKIKIRLTTTPTFNWAHR